MARALQLNVNTRSEKSAWIDIMMGCCGQSLSTFYHRCHVPLVANVQTRPLDFGSFWIGPRERNEQKISINSEDDVLRMLYYIRLNGMNGRTRLRRSAATVKTNTRYVDAIRIVAVGWLKRVVKQPRTKLERC